MWYEVYIYNPAGEPNPGVIIHESPFFGGMGSHSFVEASDFYADTPDSSGIQIYNVIYQTMIPELALRKMYELKDEFHADRLRDFRIGISLMELVNGRKVRVGYWEPEENDFIDDPDLRTKRREAELFEEDEGIEHTGWMPYGEVPVVYSIWKYFTDDRGYAQDVAGDFHSEDRQLIIDLLVASDEKDPDLIIEGYARSREDLDLEHEFADPVAYWDFDNGMWVGPLYDEVAFLRAMESERNAQYDELIEGGPDKWATVPDLLRRGMAIDLLSEDVDLDFDEDEIAPNRFSGMKAWVRGRKPSQKFLKSIRKKKLRG
jgi:hypothetical protein